MENICTGSAKCPIFNGILSGKEMTSRAYRLQYCEGSEEKWSSCKRFMTKKIYGVCPPELLPNSPMTIEQIGVKYHLN